MASDRYAHEPAYRRKLKYHAIMSKGDTTSACGLRVCYDTFVIYDRWCKIDRKRLCKNCLRAVTDPLAIEYERHRMKQAQEEDNV
jgi:hypothetical protein